MMMTYNRNHRIWKVDCRKNISADASMQFHFFELSWRQWTGFIQNILRYGELSHVVQQCGGFDCLYLCVVGQSHRPCQTDSINLHSSNMAMCDLVLRVDG